MNKEEITRRIRQLNRREFGYITFIEDALIRHLAVEDEDKLAEFLVQNAPRDFYHSSAYYLFPEREMHEKEWMASDLIFDIDADHLQEKGLRPTVFYLCNGCGEHYEKREGNCERCGGNLRRVDWLDERDLELAKKETMRLIDILEGDLGFRESDVEVYFSGSRGYHVHVYGEEAKKLGPEERIEITDYIRLTGYNMRYEDDERKRTAKLISAIMEGADEGFLMDLSEREKETFASSLKRLGLEGGGDFRRSLAALMGETPAEVRRKMEAYVIRQGMVGIDPVVTTDTHRLIRAPVSLHGKTGLVKKPVADIESFNPFIDAVGLPEGEVDIHVKYSPKIFMKDREFGSYGNEAVTVPTYVAAFLMGRGVADVQ
ncbi:MAG: DNA primase small subunit domain-containing protein [Candidatus Geothermarchaeales archaeon]